MVFLAWRDKHQCELDKVADQQRGHIGQQDMRGEELFGA